MKNQPPSAPESSAPPEDTGKANTLSTIGVSLMTLISRILGFVRIAVTTYYFGAGGQADVINLTFNIPNNLRKLMAEGALSSAFIPVFSESLLLDKTGGKAKSIVCNIFYFQIFILVPLCLFSVVFARPLIHLILADFKNPWQADLAVSLFRYFIHYLFFISIAALFMGVLNSHRHFLIPAITPVLFSVFVIACIVLFTRSLSVYSIVLGVLLGGLAQVLFQMPLFLRLGYGFAPRFNFKSPEFKRVLAQWLPVIASSLVFTVTQAVAFRLASSLEEGSASALSNAVVFWQLPMGIFSASIITVLFPQMSRQAAGGDSKGLSDSIRFGVSFLFVFLAPTTVYFFFNGSRIITLALERGLFTRQNTLMTSRVLRGYSLGLFSSGLFNFLQRYFYAIKKFRSTFFVCLAAGALDLGLSLILMRTSLRVSGLALANTLAFTLGSAFFLFSMPRKGGMGKIALLLANFGKALAASAVLGLFLWIFNSLSHNAWEQASLGGRVILFAAESLGALGLVFLCYVLFKVEMLYYFLKRKKGHGKA